MKRRSFIKQIILASVAPEILTAANYAPFYPPPAAATKSQWTTVSSVGSSPQNNSGFELGRKLTVGASNVVVSDLGVYVLPSSTFVHTLHLWRDSDQALLATATLDFTGLSDLNFTAIAPVTLQAGASYRISMSGGGDGAVQVSTESATAVATPFGDCYATAPNLYPVNSVGQGPFGCMTFKYTSP